MLDREVSPHVPSRSGGKEYRLPSRAMTAHELGIVPLLHEMLPNFGVATRKVPVVSVRERS